MTAITANTTTTRYISYSFQCFLYSLQKPQIIHTANNTAIIAIATHKNLTIHAAPEENSIL